MIKFFKYLLEAIIVYLFFFLGKILELFLSRKFFSFVFKIFGPIFKSKKIINGNLELLSKNISSNQKKQIISNMWSNYGKTFIEYVYLKNFRNNSSHINIKGEEILNSILISKEPVIFVSGHFANFELMSMELTKKKINLATIYRPLNNFFLNFFMEYLRKK